MKRLNTVFQFEFRELFKKKSMLISTLIISLLFFAATFAPRIYDHFSSSDPDIIDTDNDFIDNYLSDLSNTIIVAEDEDLLEELKKDFSMYSLFNFSNDVNKAIDDVKEEKYDMAFIMSSTTSYKVVRLDNSFDFTEDIFYDFLWQNELQKNYIKQGIDIEKLNLAEDINIDVEYDILGKDATQGMAFGFIALFALYLLILLYGQLVATSVAREKDSRAMELLITSTNPKTLIVGKVFAAGLVGFIQVAFISLLAFIGFKINYNTYPEFIANELLGAVSFDVLLMYVVFSFSGYLLYLFIYAALGSLVSKVEDVASAVSSVTVIFVIAYLIASTAMTSPNSTIVRISSFIPFVSLFTMPIRYMMTSLATSHIIISLIIMLTTTWLVALVSIYIYRKGSLNYGNKMSIFRLLKTAFKK